ncbi:hypothetical protein [Duganella sp. Root1480D1]|uniref:hypothetical protein n=1 Tax=Duganella sp. Root1480D1 TaxID=1736471 RepID=UPI0007097D6F|nr:hypothetical protein [Duganella sp. Root1480D1]KQZ44694.1 hypothetical protein ASD58_00020 [Duganella sp. Root1480D1]
MDNKPLEQLAENYIKVELGKANFKYAKPDYDLDGTDLIVLQPISKHYVRQVIVQSKGRSVGSQQTNVRINKSYVNSNFICFLYLQLDNDPVHYFYIFFCDDIKKWDAYDKYFQLLIPKDFKKNTALIAAKFNPKTHIKKIADLLDNGPIVRPYYVEFEKMGLVSILMELWRKYNSLPDLNLAIELYNQKLGYAESFIQEIFLSYNYIKNNENIGSIDYFLQIILEMRNVGKPIFELCTIEDMSDIQAVNSSNAIVYRDLRIGQVRVLYDGDSYKGLYIYIGDREDHAEVLLLDNDHYFAYGVRKVFTED